MKRRRASARLICAISSVALFATACGGESESTAPDRDDNEMSATAPSTASGSGADPGPEADVSVSDGPPAEALSPLLLTAASDATISVEELAARYGGSWTLETPTHLNAYEIEGSAISVDSSECDIKHSASTENLAGVVFEGVETYEQWFFEGEGHEDPVYPGEVSHFDVGGSGVANITTALFSSPDDATAFFGSVSGLTCGTSEMTDPNGELAVDRFVTPVDVPGFDEAVVGSYYLSSVAVGRSGAVVITAGFSTGELESNPNIAADGPAQADVVEFLAWLRSALAGGAAADAPPPPPENVGSEAASDCPVITVDDRGGEASQISTNIDCDQTETVIRTVHETHSPWSMPPEVSVDPYYCTFVELPVEDGGGGRRGRYSCNVGTTLIEWVFDAPE